MFWFTDNESGRCHRLRKRLTRRLRIAKKVVVFDEEISILRSFVIALSDIPPVSQRSNPSSFWLHVRAD